MKITAIWAREILDSRGNPTVEVEVFSEDGFGSAAAPSGASTGKYEAYELRDGEPRYLGKGVLRAVENVNSIIAPALIGMDISNQQELDKKMIALDGTPNKSNLGANAIVATSMALLRAAAGSNKKLLHDYLGGKTLPHAMFNVINGGKHAGGKLAVQEFMIIPESDSFSERLAMASEIYHVLGKQLAKNYGVTARNVGDEGGYAPPIDNTYKALDSLVAAADEAGYSKECSFALDCAASSFFSNDRYMIDSKTLRDSELLDYYVDLAKAYPIKSIEDPFDEENFSAFSALAKAIRGVQIVGDDLVVTNPVRIKKAIEEGSMTALLLKINQIGTVTEALSAAKMCKDNRINIIVSHRSGETEDCFISDFAVGINASYIKAGAPARGERTAKYNQLLRIEEQITLQALAQSEQGN
ncbi:phosphopyruvate hydratase [Candidatus Micrarchaeota archaeon]|nr:phosphopyruvate hydratase [Candidatus Micrarchaeota archaeon]